MPNVRNLGFAGRTPYIFNLINACKFCANYIFMPTTTGYVNEIATVGTFIVTILLYIREKKKWEKDEEKKGKS
jgi:hypothetical protein